MQGKICVHCGTPIKKLKHSILCNCGPRIAKGSTIIRVDKSS